MLQVGVPQIAMITSKLESDGHAVLNTGLRRSELIAEGILEAKRNFILGKRTLSLFYAADFADQLENKIIPALHAGYIWYLLIGMFIHLWLETLSGK